MIQAHGGVNMGRTKGSKNGISTTPGYIAIGEKAIGNILRTGKRIGRNLATKYKPVADMAVKKFTTKEKNPAMPSTTAKYIDKQKEIKEKTSANPNQNGNVDAMKNMLSSLASKIPTKQPSKEKVSTAKATTDKEPEKKSSRRANLISTLSSVAEGIKTTGKAIANNPKVKEVTNKVKEKVVGSVGSGIIKDEANKALNSYLDKNLETYDKPKYTGEKGTNENLQDAVSDTKNLGKMAVKDYSKNTMNRFLNDERLKDDLSAVANKYVDGGQDAALKYLADKVTDRGELKKYSDVALDSAVPTYDKRKASDKNRMAEFIKADLQDRMNDAKKKAKENVSNKVSKTVAKVTNDKRLKDEVKMFKENPQKAIKQIQDNIKNDPQAAQRYKEVLTDVALPTYDERKASTDDNFFDFLLNDIQDRSNDATKRLKKAIVTGY